MHSESIKTKLKETCLNIYKTENPLQNNDVKNKVKQTCLIKYRTIYPNQNPNIYNNTYSKSNKIYQFVSGNTIKIQGFENYALDILINSYDENEILNKRTDMPNFYYEHDKKNHTYFPDFYIPKDNLIIEVKSTYTYKINLIKNILKAHCVRKLKFNYEIWIFDARRNLIIL
jgi:hypothetical protein